MRDREWIVNAKPQVMRDFRLMLSKSSGLDVEAPTEPYFTYKYYLGPGNNSPLVKQVLANRWWWTRVGEAEKATAHLVWTQTREKPLLKQMVSLEAESRILEEGQQFQLTCQTKYLDPKSTSLLNQTKAVDLGPLGYGSIWQSESFGVAALSSKTACGKLRVHNKLEGNYQLSNKKGLLYNLKSYYAAFDCDPFQVMPRTFHIQSVEDEFEQLRAWYPGGPLILKPGEYTNRGNGITVCASLQDVRAEMASVTWLPTPS